MSKANIFLKTPSSSNPKILQYLEFLLSQPFYLIIMLISLIIMGIGIKKIEVVDKKITLKDRDKIRLIDWILILLGIFCLFISFITSLVRWLVENNLNIDWLSKYDGVILALIFGFLSLICIAFVLTQINRLGQKRTQFIKDIQGQLNDLEKKEVKLIRNIEDATRRILKGFPDIFDRAYRMFVQDNEETNRKIKEICIVNFMLEFGRPHVVNNTLCEDYQKNTGRDFENDVNTLYNKIESQIYNVPRVTLVTVTNKGVKENFLDYLVQRPGYKALNNSKIPEICQNFQGHKEHFKGVMNNRKSKNWTHDNHYFKMCEIPSLPIQFFVVGFEETSNKPEKWCCLVFMLGTEILRGISENNTKIEAGFYTERKEVADLFIDLANALVSQNIPEKEYNESK